MKEEIQKCIKILNEGGVILYPTDTIWGIGCDATNESAVAKIFKLKQRDDAKSLITIVSSDGMLQKYVEEVPELAWDIIDLATRPTTIVYPKGKNLAQNCLAQDGTVGIRLMKNGFAKELIHRFNKPIISTSANTSGLPSPEKFLDISEDIKSKVDLIVNSNFDDSTFSASSIIKLEIDGTVQVLRK